MASTREPPRGGVNMGRLGRRSRVTGLVLVGMLLAVYAGSAQATSEPAIRADLEGRPIPAVEVGRYACHDLDFPLIHCYRSPEALDEALAARLAGQAGAPTLALAAYVKVFPDWNLQGNPAVLTVRYDDLSVIGWNDRISSFQGLAGVGGRFFEHIYGSGRAYPFSAYQIVTYVGDPYNDTFSSVAPG